MTAASTRTSGPPHVLVIGNNAVPTDRRIWLECLALREAGLAVSVICPNTRQAPARERIDGVELYRYRALERTGSARHLLLGYLRSLLHSLRLAWSVWRRDRFDVVQACNPPDLYFLIALCFRPFGVRFLFDQHDLSPEIYGDRYADGPGWVHTALLRLERLTHRAADHVITVNESCRELLLSRTGIPPERLTVIRSGPDVARLPLVDPDPELANGRRHLCAYLGVMGPQDGVDLVLRAVDVLVHDLGREDVQFVLMGDGECRRDLIDLAERLRVTDWVRFTGWADDRTISAVLSSSDLGLQPDRSTPFTELCSMLKTVEYMAFGLPVVAFDLAETRRTAGAAVSIVPEQTPQAYARRIAELLDDPDHRAAMSAHGLRRARTELAWAGQKPRYVDVVRALAGRTEGQPKGVTMNARSHTRPDRSRRPTPGGRNVDVEVAIVGAGPYGLATAAHLRDAGCEVRVFGSPLEFWRTHTPVGMWLRSPYQGSNIGDPRRQYTLGHYEQHTGQTVPRPIPVERFNDYGLWFAQQAVPDLDQQDVRRVGRIPGGFVVETATGSLTARRVVVAAGVGTFAHVPEALEHLSGERCSHTMSHHDLAHLAGRRVTIIGGGQSALETAALLHELRAEVDVAVRAPFVRWLSEGSWKHTTPVVSSLLYAKPDVGPALVSHLVAHPRLYTRLPMDRQLRWARRSVRPAGAGWLRPRLQPVPIRLGRSLTAADETGDGVKLFWRDGTVDLVEHVVAATGYRVDLAKYAFLDAEMLPAIERVDGYPTLSASFETSVAGLHMVGAPAARRHGPLMRFVAGSDFAARAVTRGVRR